MKKVQRGAASDLRINMHTEQDKKFPYNYLAWEKTCLYMGVVTHSDWQGEAGPIRAGLIPTLLPDTTTIQGNE
jgi:hypothetical protein